MDARSALQIGTRPLFLVIYDLKKIDIGRLARAVVTQNPEGSTFTVSLVLGVYDTRIDQSRSIQNAMIDALRGVSGVQSGLTTYDPATDRAIIHLSDIGAARLYDIINALMINGIYVKSIDEI